MPSIDGEAGAGLKGVVGVGINWRQAERHEFEWVFEQLMLREHRGAADVVRIPDDRGGDGGIDILVDYPNRRLVYQLKFYTDGLSSNERTRKGQIKRSFDKAMKLSPRPDVWILVVPCKYKDSIVTYVKDNLIAKVTGPQPVFSMIDQPELDFLLLAQPDLLSRMSRDDHFTTLVRLHRAEQSVLAGGVADLTSRLRALNSVAAELDDHWTLAYATDGKNITLTPVAKHPHAAERSPLGVQFGIDLTAADDELLDDLDKVVGFGAPGEVVVPGAVVTGLRWTGPELLDPTKGTLAEMRIGESAPVASLTGKPCRLSLFDADGTATAHAEGPITRIAPGTTGYTIAATFHHSLHLELRAPMQAGKPGEANMTLTLGGREPREVWRGIDLRHAICEAVTAQVHVDGIPYFTAQLDAAVSDEDQRSLSALADAARDLDVVQDRTGTIFAMPDEINALQRIWLRVLRIILDGGIAPLPRNSVQGRTHPGATLPTDGELHAALVDYRPGIVELFGRPLNLGGPLFYYHPCTRTEVLDAEPDDLGCYPFRMTSSDETVFVGYIAGCVTTTTVVTPWSVEGIEDPDTPTLPVGAS
ncbi:hypothetical protein APR12_006386 [Nocardia amikacinitolerans]|uniref:hypothetical protein n=1 Tax=Nocardia amikacinitolerans TaxID=756689 RepID=UPI000ABCFB1A|nr:hypothetical protein [Nocardia amikacinitolerans]MCP2320996.1 hypothetical protein [Nocardia amikacinitolerans]